MNHIKNILIITLIYIIFSSQNLYSQITITEKKFEGIILASDLVIRGVISEINVCWVDKNIILGNNFKKGDESIATKITILIEEIVAGEYRDKHITAILTEGKLHGTESGIMGYELLELNIGDNIFVGLQHNNFGNKNYFIYRQAFYKIDNETLYPYEKKMTLEVNATLEFARRIAIKRSYEWLYANSDIICIGKLESNDFSKQVLSILVEEYLKGNDERNQILIKYSGYIIEYNEINSLLLLFLKKDNLAYYNHARMNGVYLIDSNGNLTRDHKSTLSMNIKKLKSIITNIKDE